VVTDKTEEEQVEALKNWWDENGTQLLIGAVVVLAGIFGYRYWDSSTQATAEMASKLYEDLVQVANTGPFDQLSDEDRSTAEFIASQLKTDYTKTTYAHFASMHMAKLAVEADDLDGAEAALRWSLDNGVDETILPIVNERLARVLFAKEDYDTALQQLDKAKPGKHALSYEELRGDIYTAMDRTEDARAAYERAIAAADNPDAFPYLQMKLHDIPDPGTSVIDSSEPEGDSSDS
jgi:predicted negative regulator of RcsB-dependent stress response